MVKNNTLIKDWLKDKHHKRGMFYSAIGLAGVLFELIFRSQPELLVILFYTAIVGIGLICMIFLKDKI